MIDIYLISRVFQQFRKDACLPGDDRISESFIKAAKALIEPVDTSSRQSFEAWAMDFYGCERAHVDHFAGVDGYVIWQASGSAKNDVDAPMQTLVKDKHGTVRFKENAIVRHLLDNGGIDMNALAMLDFSDGDREQFAQLIGYSVGGYGELSYVSNESYDRAHAIMTEMLP